MASIFTKIIEREIPAYIVAEDSKHIAFLDINPLMIGHTLVVPKKEVDYIYNLPDNDLSDLHLFAKKVASAIKKSVPCERIGVTVMGLEVPHTHVHLIPINSMDDMNFSRAKLSLSKEVMEETAQRIKSHL